MKLPKWLRRAAPLPAPAPAPIDVPAPAPAPAQREPVVVPAPTTTGLPYRQPAPPEPERPASAGQRWKALSAQVREHRSAYYTGSSSTVTDQEFDALLNSLVALESEYPELRRDSPTQPLAGSAPPRAPRRRPGRSTAAGAAVGRGYAVLDVETTGFSAARERVVEIAVVHLDPDGQLGQSWSSLVHPARGTIPAVTTAVHGITIEDVCAAPRFEHIAAELVEQLSGRVIVAHNADFDLRFLAMELARAGIAMPEVTSLCTMEASFDHLPHLAKRRLSDCCTAAGVDLSDAHSAAGDAQATAALLGYYLTCPTGAKAARGYADLMAAAASVDWPASPTGITARPPTPRTDAAHRPRPAAPGRLADLLDHLPQTTTDPPEASTYRDLLTRALAGVVLTDDAVDVLASVATTTGLTRDAALEVHRGVLADLAGATVEDGKITRIERATLLAHAQTLALGEREVTTAVATATDQRAARLGADLRALPDGWAHGQALHLGDRVAFTGGESGSRAVLERAATSAGLTVTSTVSVKTAALITNDATTGTAKARAALTHATRIIDPATFAILLDHLQPPTGAPRAQPREAARPRPSTPASSTPSPAPTPTAPQQQQAASAPPALIRAWARAQGITVSDRGRLPAALVERYHREMGLLHE